MKHLILTTAALLLTATAALADSTFQRTLNVPSQPDLYVSTGSGNVRIFPGSGGQIKVVGHVHAGWSAFGDVNGRIQRIVENPPITQDGSSIHVGDSNDHSLFNSISIDYEVTVPAEVALNLHSGSGDIEVDHVGRFLAADTGSGSVRAHGIHGAVQMQSGSGDLELQQEGQGDVKARSGSGSIRINGLNGGLMARTGSGDIEANGRLQGAANLTSGSGSVRMHLSNDVHFNLEASTGSGSIRVNFPGLSLSNGDSRHHLTAPVNGGGAPLEVHTGSGDIEVDGRS